jgi:hypothetical protein
VHLRSRAALPEWPFTDAPGRARPICVHQQKLDQRDSEKTNDEKTTAISDKQNNRDCLRLIQSQKDDCE